MNEKQYIFLDVDGTLVTPQGEFPKSAQKALKTAQENGHEIFVCTGRVKSKIHKELQDFGFDGFIAATGEYADYHNKIVNKQTFSVEVSNKIFNMFKKLNTPFMIETENDVVFPSWTLTKFAQCYLSYEPINKTLDDLVEMNVPFLPSLMPITVDDETEKYSKKYKDIFNINYVQCTTSIDKLRKLLPKEARVEKASFKSTDPYSGEITLKDCYKARGIKQVLDFVGASQKQCIVVGDGPNDKDMMEFGHISIAMGNAIPELKKLATYVTTDILDDGIYNAFKHYKLIQ